MEETSFGQTSVDTSTNTEVGSLEGMSTGWEEGVEGRRQIVRRKKEFRPFRRGRRVPEVERRLGKCRQKWDTDKQRTERRKKIRREVWGVE